MPTLLTMETWFDLAMVPLWCLAVWGLGHVLFRSHGPAWILRRLRRPDPHAQEIATLRWELAAGIAMTPEVAQNLELAKARQIPPAEAKARLDKLPRLSEMDLDERRLRLAVVAPDATMLARVGGWLTRRLADLLTCPFCHHAWAAVIAVCLCGRFADPWDAASTVAAYATLTTALGDRLFADNHAPQRHGGTCPGKG